MDKDRAMGIFMIVSGSFTLALKLSARFPLPPDFTGEPWEFILCTGVVVAGVILTSDK